MTDKDTNLLKSFVSKHTDPLDEPQLHILIAILECLERIEEKQNNIASSITSINEFGITSRDQR